MNWVKQNKFVAGLLAVAIVGIGAFGYLIFSAMGRADESSQKFEQTKTDLQHLEGLPVYPNAKNLKTLEGQRGEHQDRVTALVETVSQMAPPLEQITPEQFQDRLRETVNKFTAEAGTAGMKLPTPFYFGFDPYQGTPPRPEAAPQLDRQLKAIDLVLRTLLEAHVAELRALARETLPEEKASASSGTGKGAKTAAVESAMLRKLNFEVTFLSEQAATQKVLNTIVAEKKWFLVPRVVAVKNEKLTGPAREGGATSEPPPPEAPPAAQPPPTSATPAPMAGGAGATPAAPVAAPPAATAAAPAAAAAAATAANATVPPPPVPPAAATGKFEFIVGQEKIETSIALEAIVFNPPAEPAHAKPKPQK